jgi:hypothetical protein
MEVSLDSGLNASKSTIRASSDVFDSGILFPEYNMLVGLDLCLRGPGASHAILEPGRFYVSEGGCQLVLSHTEPFPVSKPICTFGELNVAADFFSFTSGLPHCCLTLISPCQ